MALYLLRRLLLLVVAIAVTSVLVFVLLRLLPGDLARVVAGTEASQERVDALREELGSTVRCGASTWSGSAASSRATSGSRPSTSHRHERAR